MSVFSRYSSTFGQFEELLIVLDSFTISRLPHNLRQPIEDISGIGNVLDLDRVIGFKSSVWKELCQFYERQ